VSEPSGPRGPSRKRRADGSGAGPTLHLLLLWAVSGATPVAAAPRQMVRDFPNKYCPVHGGKPVSEDGTDVLLGEPARVRDELSFIAPGASVVVTVSTCAAGSVLQAGAEIGLDNVAVVRSSSFLAHQIDRRLPSVPERLRAGDPFNVLDCYQEPSQEGYSRTVGTLFDPSLKPACGPSNPDCPFGDDFEDPVASSQRWQLGGVAAIAELDDGFGVTNELVFASSAACSEATVTIDHLAAGESYVLEYDWRAFGYQRSLPVVTVDIGAAGAAFFTLPPCRLIDTRGATGTRGGPALSAGEDRAFPLAGPCDIPPTALAVAVNLAVTQPTAPGNLRLYPQGVALPTTSSINYSAMQTRANNAIVPLGTSGAIVVHCSQATGTAHFILDVNGYFE
jgi:hypothetical protein